MVSFIKVFIKYLLLYKFNKVSKEGFCLLDEKWKNKPISGINLWLYNKIKRINERNTSANN